MAATSLGDETVPYPANETGPLCPQGGLEQEFIEDVVGIPIRDTAIALLTELAPEIVPDFAVVRI